MVLGKPQASERSERRLLIAKMRRERGESSCRWVAVAGEANVQVRDRKMRE